MHSRIYQITSEEQEREDYLTSGSLEYNEISDFADYTADIDEGEEEDELNDLARLLTGVFRHEGRTLIYEGAETFIREWHNKIREQAMTMTVEDFKDWRTLFDLRQITDETHLRTPVRFYGYDGDDLPYPMGDFITHAFVHLKPGDKLYVGGILDYHG